MNRLESKQLLSLLRKPEHRYEGEGGPKEGMLLGQGIVLELSQEQNKLYTAILKATPKEDLLDMAEQLRQDPSSALSLREKIEWMSSEHPSKKVLVKNEPIGRLLRFFLDKKSKKVTYARTHLRERFPQQSYRDQNKILRAFLEGSKDDCEWAARYLRDNWRKDMTGAVADAWYRVGTQTLAYVILRHFPNDYILLEEPKLSKVAGYQYVCARVGNEPSFVLDESRLDTAAYFYVMAKLGRKVDPAIMEYRFQDYLLQYPYDYRLLRYAPVSLLSIEGVGRMIWAMGVLGMQDALVRLLELRNKVQDLLNAVGVNDPHELWPYFVAYLKMEIDPFGEQNLLEKEMSAYEQLTSEGRYYGEDSEEYPLF